VLKLSTVLLLLTEMAAKHAYVNVNRHKFSINPSTLTQVKMCNVHTDMENILLIMKCY